MKILSSIRFLIASFHQRIWIVVFFSVLLSALLIPVSFLVKIIFDQAIPNADISLLLKLTLTLIALMACSGIFSIYTRATIIRHTKRAISGIRNSLTAKLLRMSHVSYQQADLSRIHKVLVYDTEKLDNFANAIFSVIIPSACISFCLAVILLILNVQMSLLLFIVAPFILLLTELLRRACKKSLRQFQLSFENFHRKSLFLLELNKLIKVSSTQQKEADLHKDIITELEDSSLNMAIGYIKMSNYQEVIFSISSIILLAWGSYTVMKGEMTIGTLMSFYFCLFLLKRYLTTIGNAVPAVLEGSDSWQQCTSILKEESDEIYTGIMRGEFDGRIECKDLTFSFGELVLFKKYNLSLRPGETTLVVGPNGSGKSTLVNLILGLYQPQEGALYASGIPYSTWDIQYLRSKIAVVLQEDTTFQGTILDNIVYGISGVDITAVQQAVLNSGLHEFIESLPDGLYTMIGEKGAKLSGGQRQKIAIARCFLAKASLVILDEPTNHLDQHSVELIATTLKNQAHTPSILIISHTAKLQSLADNIIELKTSYS
ncbi:ABC transporter ATP-binding protein [Ohtaekwangia koreensis]|uniref:ABC transporter transmembrane region n=1 Tax=Ohtaekwangia koreensis TaxID=688867 RepID=A0A1T5JRH6_9BACT|nr:ABC transporter ATP-binding protein [Ohtaekwangia koreensis]SKC54010.1 ABC transporter transmembrane region [Ohtaekwangia koreensis]